MGMIKSLVPPEQKFSELASQQFFLLRENRNVLYQKIIPVNGLNAIELSEDESNHGHSHSYELALVTIPANAEVRHINVVHMEIKIMPNLDKPE